MGFRYQELKERGDSIELERRESFTTERSHNGYIKRKKTIVRERFQHPNAKGARHNKQQETPQSEVLTTQRQGTESGLTTTETFAYTPASRILISNCRDKSHLERAVNRTSVQLKRLAHEIDNEIAKLKRERDKLMLRPRPHPLMRNAAIQNDLQCEDVPIKATTNVKLKDFNAIADNIEFTIEKFSSQHKFVCTSPRYARDEQTSCRPHMRTIGLQKDTERNSASIFSDNLQNLKVKLGTALNNSPTNLANLKATGLLDPAPPNCYAFDYGGTGDGQNALKVYHLQNCRYSGGCNPNADCNCQKICERYNTVGNYNGMLCNKNTYVEKGVTLCSKYKYCHDEYHYDYRPNSPCRPCTPCITYQPSQQPCQPCVVPCLPSCPTYNESQPSKPKLQVIYGRRMSDLNTDEFYHPTGGSSPTEKHTPTKHGSGGRRFAKERLTVDIPKYGRTSVDIERHGGRAQSKSRRKRDDDEEATKQRGRKSYEVGSPDKSKEKRQTRERSSRRKSVESSGSAGSSEKSRHLRSKNKLLEITFTKERPRKASSGSGDELIPYEPQPDRETREAKRSMKQMTITAYKPCKPLESEDEPESTRKKKKTRKSKDKGAERKSEDDKTWDERLRRVEQQEPRVEQPQEEEDWRSAIPTAEEYYGNYRVGDAWEAEEINVARQQQYAGAYRESFQVSPRRSYDIMPVQKDTVRDMPPAQSPVRGRRLVRESQTVRNEDNAVSRSQTPHGGYIAESRIAQDGPVKTGKGYSQVVRPDSRRSYGVEDKSRPIRESAEVYDYKTGRAYSPGDTSRPIGKSTVSRDYETGQAYSPGYKSRPVAQGKSYSPREGDRRYMVPRQSGEDGESINTPKSGTVYARDERPSSARNYDYGPKSDKSYDARALRADHERSSRTTPGNIHALDAIPRSASDSTTGEGYKSDKKYLGKMGPSRAGFEERTSTSRTGTTLERKAGPGRDAGFHGSPKAEKIYMEDEIVSQADYEHKPSIDAIYGPDGKLRSARDYDHSVGPKADKWYVGESSSHARQEPDRETSAEIAALGDKRSMEESYKPDNMPTSISGYAREDSSRSPQGKLQSPRDYDSGVQSIPARSHDANTTSYETLKPTSRTIHPQDKRQQESTRVQDPTAISTPGKLTPLTKQTSHKMEEKPTSGRLKGDTSKGERDDYDTKEKSPEGWNGKPQILDGYAEKVKVEPSGVYLVAGKPDTSIADVHAGETEKSYMASPQMSPSKIEKSSTGYTGSPTKAVNPKADSTLTEKDLDYHGPEVPEIHIEDNDESGRSTRSGKEESARSGMPERAKFAVKGEMVLEPQYSRDGEQPAQTEDRTKHGVVRTDSPSGAYQQSDNIGVSDKTERFRNANAFDESQLSPFPSLESPRIYMRPRTACPDYGTACLPPTSDCPKKSNTRGNCIENAGDVYMCRPDSYSGCQPTSPCPCESPNRSCNEIPYEKLGDQYTHSPVRQLAANSHLAVALQPDAATGNYIPSPQSKNCIYLRSTGTQYSATIIENHEDRCAPQYIPLPKDCSQMPLEEQKETSASCRPPERCDASCEEFQTVTYSPKNNYKFLCEEEEDENEMCDDKINHNNDQWCERVEITNAEKYQILVRQQQTKETSPRLDCKKYFLPWKQDQKFIPGQPLSECEMQDAVMQQRVRCQSLAERRMPRFNATMAPHQEMPEEEARCADETPMYKPQPRVQFMEETHRQYENSDSCCQPQAEEPNLITETMEPASCYRESERPGFNDCREFQQIPQFTGCPCMFKTYLNMVTLYYPDCRIQMPDDADAEAENGCCYDDGE